MPFVAAAPEAHAAKCPGASVVEKAGNALIDAAKSGSPNAFAGALKQYADMNSIALFALGQYRKQLPAGRTDEFVDLTTSYISRTLNDYRLKFRAQSINVKGCSGQVVDSSLFFLGGKGFQPVTWRLKGSKISDVNIQNVWLAQLLKSNFQGILDKNQGSIEALIAEMKR